MTIEMLPIMGRLVIVLGEQGLKHGHRRTAVGGLGVLAVRPDQMFVAGGDIAAAGIAHE